MMYPRLVLLKQFLREDGAIFISIDDNEVATLRLLMDEIYRTKAFIGDIVWQHSVQAKGYSGILSLHHNHTLVYGNHGFRLGDLVRTVEHNVNYSNPDNDPRGPWRSGDVRNALVRPNLMYDITTPNGNIIKHPPKGWRFSRETFERELGEGKILYSKDQARIIRKIYLADQTGRVPESLWFASEAGTTREATNEVAEILGTKGEFDTPKPTRLIQRILQIATDKESIVLDSFAGSGTTGHAVLKQNAEDGGNRRFILVEMDENITQNVTAERVRRVCEGYTNTKGKEIESLGGGFQFCRLSDEPLFKADGPIRADVTFAQLAEFVWFMETGTGLAQSVLLKRQNPTPFLGIYKSRAVFLLYNGILKDKSDPGGNVLNARTLDVLNEELPDFGGPRVVYGARSRFDKQKLAKLGITFHQLPYELAVKTWF
jgi:site-specific DNA-methyltransferase (adenine-specific)/adenine-specific DNA-methyltransferase